MSRNSLWNSPLIASALAWAVPGLGHIYLRRWLRAAGWLAGVFLVVTLFGSAQPTDALAVGTFDAFVALLPVALVIGASMLDAYRIATAMRTDSAPTGRHSGTDLPDELVVCQSCGRGVDADLGFCHWCTTEFDTDGNDRLAPSSN